MKKTLLCLLIFGLLAGPAQAASQKDINLLDLYAGVLGKALACGADTTKANYYVANWLRGNFNEEERPKYILILQREIIRHYELQRAGRAQDTCSEVRRNYKRLSWPWD